jgi:hypothetical protein
MAIALFGGFQLGLFHLKRERLASDRLVGRRRLNLHEPESPAGFFLGGANAQQQLIALRQALAHGPQFPQ